jgi:hypothetical protein
MKKFPSDNENDLTNIENLWELLSRKLKIKLENFLIQILPSITSPPQNMMNPVSLELDIGINEDTDSIYHIKLPKIVILTKIDKLNLKMNQNQ